jgi:hypothetical protein
MIHFFPGPVEKYICGQFVVLEYSSEKPYHFCASIRDSVAELS